MSTPIHCGELHPKNDNAGKLNGFSGRILLADLIQGTLTLAPNPRASSNSEAPDYLVSYHPSRATGAPYQIGAAWIKNSEKVNGGDFLSMTLDSPRWTNSVNLSAFPPDESTVSETAETRSPGWRVVWSRPRGAKVQEDQLPSFA